MQTNEVKAAACVLKQPFFTYERILGLVGPGSKAFVLYALNAAEIRKRGGLLFHICQMVKKYVVGQCRLM